MKYKSRGEKIFDVVNSIFMVFAMIVTLYPFLHVLVGSISDPLKLVGHRGLLFYPVGDIQFNAYQMVLDNEDFFTGYLNTLFYVVFGTSISLVLTISLGYVLSRKNVMLNPLFTVIVVFPLFFSGGMIPTYLLYSDLNLIDTRGAVLMAGLLSTTNIIIMRTAFKGVPESLDESARIDGANDISILTKVMLPLTMPTIAVQILFYGVARWNEWFSSFIYLRERSKFPLQLILREILIDSGTGDMAISWGGLAGVDYTDVIKYSSIIISIVPVLCVYPFLQKYFTKGVMIGAVKG